MEAEKQFDPGVEDSTKKPEEELSTKDVWAHGFDPHSGTYEEGSLTEIMARNAERNDPSNK